MKHVKQYSSYNPDSLITNLSSSEIGVNILKDVQDNLTLAGEERLRMEDEGGIPLNTEQNKKVSRYLKGGQRIKKLLSSFWP